MHGAPHLVGGRARLAGDEIDERLGLGGEILERRVVAEHAFEDHEELALLLLGARRSHLCRDVGDDDEHLGQTVALGDGDVADVEQALAVLDALGHLGDAQLDRQHVFGQLLPVRPQQLGGGRAGGDDVIPEARSGRAGTEHRLDGRRLLRRHRPVERHREEPLAHVVEHDAHVAVASVELVDRSAQAA